MTENGRGQELRDMVSAADPDDLFGEIARMEEEILVLRRMVDVVNAIGFAVEGPGRFLPTRGGTRRARSPQADIMRVLNASERPLSYSELLRALAGDGDLPSGSVSSSLTSMVRTGMLRRPQRGMYEVANARVSVLEPQQ